MTYTIVETWVYIAGQGKVKPGETDEIETKRVSYLQHAQPIEKNGEGVTWLAKFAVPPFPGILQANENRGLVWCVVPVGSGQLLSNLFCFMAHGKLRITAEIAALRQRPTLQ